MLAWIAAARALHIPPPPRPGARLLDVACGGGLLAAHLRRGEYQHVGVDLSAAALAQAASHGLTVSQADVCALPFADATFDVVVAGEIFEHVSDPAALLGQVCRVLRPGGTLVLDTIADTWWGRFSSITLAEHLPAGPPPRLHDGALFIDRRWLLAASADLGVRLQLVGLRPAAWDYLRWLVGRRSQGRMVSTRSTAGLFQGVGRKVA
jgi:2-polyprenyl-6-hydroxyphenyl methylase/3-demethylubiquinone-9 3-methyltransferase